MIKVCVDTLLKRVTVFCKSCGVPMIYDDGGMPHVICPYCSALVEPRPESLRKNLMYRIVFHKEGNHAELYKSSHTLH